MGRWKWFGFCFGERTYAAWGPWITGELLDGIGVSSTAFGRNIISLSLKNLIFRPVTRTESNVLTSAINSFYLNLSRELYCFGWLKSHLFDGAVLQ